MSEGKVEGEREPPTLGIAPAAPACATVTSWESGSPRPGRPPRRAPRAHWGYSPAWHRLRSGSGGSRPNPRRVHAGPGRSPPGGPPPRRPAGSARSAHGTGPGTWGTLFTGRFPGRTGRRKPRAGPTYRRNEASPATRKGEAVVATESRRSLGAPGTGDEGEVQAASGAAQVEKGPCAPGPRPRPGGGGTPGAPDGGRPPLHPRAPATLPRRLARTMPFFCSTNVDPFTRLDTTATPKPSDTAAGLGLRAPSPAAAAAAAVPIPPAPPPAPATAPAGTGRGLQGGRGQQ